MMHESPLLFSFVLLMLPNTGVHPQKHKFGNVFSLLKVLSCYHIPTSLDARYHEQNRASHPNPVSPAENRNGFYLSKQHTPSSSVPQYCRDADIDYNVHPILADFRNAVPGWIFINSSSGWLAG